MTTLDVNGKSRRADVSGDMPLIWFLRDVPGLTGSKFGCGIKIRSAITLAAKYPEVAA